MRLAPTAFHRVFWGSRNHSWPRRLHAWLTFWLLIALGQTNGSAAIWHPSSKRIRTPEKRTIALCRSLRRCQRSLRKMINNAKTQALPIGPCKYDFDLTLNGSGVTKLPSIRILGVEPDSMLNFIEHIASQLIKAYETTGALRRIRRIVPMDVISAFKSFILPHPEYCSPLLLGVGKSRPIKLKTPIIIC